MHQSGEKPRFYRDLQQAIFDKISEFGAQTKVRHNALDEEYERELEREEEEEIEREFPPAQIPADEEKWDYKRVFATPFEFLSMALKPTNIGLQLLSLADVLLETRVLSEKNAIPVAFHRRDHIYATHNFRGVVEDQGNKLHLGQFFMDQYLRRVNFVLVVKSSNQQLPWVILLSDFEANELISEFYSRMKNTTLGTADTSLTLLSYTFLHETGSPRLVLAFDGSTGNVHAGHSANIDNTTELDAEWVSLVELFNGDTMYGGEAARNLRLREVQRILQLGDYHNENMESLTRSRNFVQAIILLRHRQQEFDRSDLESLLLLNTIC